MTAVCRSAVIDVPVDDVWRLLRDFNSHAGWHPGVAMSHIDHGAPATGVVRNFRLRNGARLREQLLTLPDAGCNLTYCILDAPPPLENYVATLRPRPVTDRARTFVEWRSTFAAPAAQRAQMTRLVSEEIYEAGCAPRVPCARMALACERCPPHRSLYRTKSLKSLDQTNDACL